MLVYGFGNPGRRDDGLGVAFAERVEALHPHLRVETAYQLNAEDALTISEHDIVLFVDASCNPIDGVRLTRLAASHTVSFSTHAMSPESVVGLCAQLYDKAPNVYLVEIEGHDWGMGEGLSEKGCERLEQAVATIGPLLQAGNIRERFEQAVSPPRVSHST
jgi:hydrogenase maturation protease